MYIGLASSSRSIYATTPNNAAWRTSHVRNPFALPEIMYIGLASSSRSIYATTPFG
ncbi:MAG: hypothetical protein VB124_04655 [Burkholderia sp.]